MGRRAHAAHQMLGWAVSVAVAGGLWLNPAAAQQTVAEADVSDDTDAAVAEEIESPASKALGLRFTWKRHILNELPSLFGQALLQLYECMDCHEDDPG